MPIHYLEQRRRCVRALAAMTLGTAWTNEDRQWHARQIDQFFNKLSFFRRRASSPNAVSVRAQRDRLFTGYSGRLCAVLQEAHRRGVKHIKPVSPKQLEQLARSVCPTARTFERAVVKLQTKADGTKRITLSPGPKIRAAQRLVSDVLEAAGVDNPFDYNRAGKGPSAAIAEIIRLVEEDGIRDFVVFDLDNYFTSVEAKHLSGFSIPNKVMMHSVLFNRSAMLLHTKGNAAEAEAARHGLPQGARVSGLLASALLGRELRKLSGAKGIVTYVDDGVIGACDPAGAKSLAEAIKTRFGNHPGGPLGFKKLSVCSIEDGFQFLGYHLRLDKLSLQPKVFVKPSHEAEEKFRRKLMRKLGAMSPKPDWDAAVAMAQQYGRQWRHAYSAWHPNEAQVEEFEFLVEIFVADFLSLSVKKITNGLKPEPA